MKVLDKIEVQNFAQPGKTKLVDAQMYDAMKQAYLKVLPRKAPGLNVEEIFDALIAHLPAALYPPDDKKAVWWMKTVQLDLEAKGIVLRESTKPLRWHKR